MRKGKHIAEGWSGTFQRRLGYKIIYLPLILFLRDRSVRTYIHIANKISHNVSLFLELRQLGFYAVLPALEKKGHIMRDLDSQDDVRPVPSLRSVLESLAIVLDFMGGGTFFLRQDIHRDVL